MSLHLDGHLQLGSRSTEEIEALMRRLPSRCYAELAKGPVAEPDCRLCDTVCSLADDGLLPEQTDPWYAAVELLDYHEVKRENLVALDLALLMDGVPNTSAAKVLIGDIIGTMLFHRCQIVYEIARRLAAEQED